jgi:hypothetical protein
MLNNKAVRISQSAVMTHVPEPTKIYEYLTFTTDLFCKTPSEKYQQYLQELFPPPLDGSQDSKLPLHASHVALTI